jgi:RNA polymerase sigma-70 factor, ECF subfamily
MSTNQEINDQAQANGNQCCEDPDQTLVQRARSGDHAAFDMLMLQHKDRIFHTIFRITKNREDAEDQVQETFLRAYRGLGAFRGHSRFSSWLIRIAVNQALQCLRRYRYNQISLDQPSHSDSEIYPYDIQEWRPDPEQMYVDTEMAEQLYRRLVKLPHSLRSVLILRLYNDFTSQETATTLGISTAAVKSRVVRARRRLCNDEKENNVNLGSQS